MKTVIFVVIAAVVYAIQNVILEQKMSKYSQPAILVYFYLLMLPVVCIWLLQMKLTHQPIVAPTGTMIWLALGLGAMYLIADACYLTAFTLGGNVITITTILVMMPVVASAIKFVWTGSLPNSYQVVGYLAAVAAVLLMAKGSKV